MTAASPAEVRTAMTRAAALVQPMFWSLTWKCEIKPPPLFDFPGQGED
jgi:hypothetical protein